MGEDVGISLVETPDGEKFRAVNVGFGGGNSATYFYFDHTLKLANVFMYDGDCNVQGQTPEFPLEVAVSKEDRVKHVLTCEVKGKAPVKTMSVEFELDGNSVFTNRGKVSVLSTQRYDGLEFAPKNQEDDLGFQVGKDKTGVSGHVSLETKRGNEKWTAEVSLRLRSDKGSKVSGKVYQNKTGGYWAEDATEYEAEVSCTKLPKISGKLYKRIIRY